MTFRRFSGRHHTRNKSWCSQPHSPRTSGPSARSLCKTYVGQSIIFTTYHLLPPLHYCQCLDLVKPMPFKLEGAEVFNFRFSAQWKRERGPPYRYGCIWLAAGTRFYRSSMCQLLKQKITESPFNGWQILLHLLRTITRFAMKRMVHFLVDYPATHSSSSKKNEAIHSGDKKVRHQGIKSKKVLHKHKTGSRNLLMWK